MNDEKREKRLERMRQSQKRLRMRNAERFNLLEAKVEALKRENTRLENEIAALHGCEIFEHYALTNVELKKMIEDYSPKVGETILLNEFLTRYNINDKRLYHNQEYILVRICKKLIECLESFLSEKEVRHSPNHDFKYLQMCGRTLPSLYYAQMRAVGEERIPTSWLKCTFLPRGTLAISEALIYLIIHLKPDHADFQVLTFALARYFCATPFGPAITKEHLDKAIELSYNPKLDLFYLLGTLEVQMCDLPESLVDSLVK